MANFKRFTRYTNGTVTKTRDNEDFLVLRKPLELEEAEGDVFVTITQDLTKRPDLIADKAYGNRALWWAIYEFNEVTDPMFDLQPGRILRIPKLERLLAAIGRLNK